MNGRRVQESTRSRTKTDADRALRAKLTEIDEGRFSKDLANLRFEHLFDTIEEEYHVEGRKSMSRVRLSFKHLREHLGHLRVVEISTRALREYRRVRRREGAAPATINQEFAHLRRAMELVRQDHPSFRIPKVPKLTVNNARQGFVDDVQVQRLLAELPEYLQGPTGFAYVTGWRRSEVFGLRWKDVDWRSMEISLETSKNGEGRVIPFSALPRLGEILHRAKEETASIQKDADRIVPLVFHKNGNPVRDTRKDRREATKAAGLEGVLFHDLRRSAVRNMERAGVPRSVAMKVTGHKTESIYARYAIVDSIAMSEGLAKLAAMRAESDPIATFSATVKEAGAS